MNLTANGIRVRTRTLIIYGTHRHLILIIAALGLKFSLG